MSTITIILVGLPTATQRFACSFQSDLFLLLPQRFIMPTGTVKWFNAAKGFGFITPDGGGADLFAHFMEIGSSSYKTLAEGQRVSFDITHAPKGLQASNIKPL
jgi:CspA family cold shock protein